MPSNKKPSEPNKTSTDEQRYVKTVNYRTCQKCGRRLPVGEKCPACSDEKRR